MEVTQEWPRWRCPFLGCWGCSPGRRGAERRGAEAYDRGTAAQLHRSPAPTHHLLDVRSPRQTLLRSVAYSPLFWSSGALSPAWESRPQSERQEHPYKNMFGPGTQGPEPEDSPGPRPCVTRPAGPCPGDSKDLPRGRNPVGIWRGADQKELTFRAFPQARSPPSIS